MTKTGFKQVVCRSLVTIGLERLFRFINREKLLIIMYHGVTRRLYDPAVWTQLPVDLFRSHLEFVKEYYTVISLEQLLDFIRSGKPLPLRAALLTFDDGLMNNYTVAFPLLKEFDLPATIFLTSDCIGTTDILWFDEIYLLLKQLYQQGGTISDPLLSLGDDMPKVPAGEFPLLAILNWMKRLSPIRRNEILNRLRSFAAIDVSTCCEDFCYLGWDEIRVMQSSGLIDFGVHTASHEILTNLGEADLCREVIGSREVIEHNLGRQVPSFCYPNGRPGEDFTREHGKFLAKNGYLCAFSTQSGLCRKGDDLFALKRIPAGNDVTSAPDFFRLNTSGALGIARKLGWAS